MPKDAVLTIDQVRDALEYDADTGAITWKINVSRNIKAGTIAGSVKATRSRHGKSISYRYIRLHDKEMPAARLVWFLYYGKWPRGNVLFDDGDSSNLRIVNLRQAIFPRKEMQAGSLDSRKMTREAMRHYGLKRYYGLSPEEFGAMMAAQGGVCAICEKPETAVFNGRVKEMHVDHNHETGVIRDLLCYRCNSMLGSAKETPETLRAAADYLERHAERIDAKVIPIRGNQ